MGNTLHGGETGFHTRIWKFEQFESPKAGVKLTYTSANGEEGFPGTLSVAVSYSLTDTDELVMDFEATTDAPTHVNLTNHTFWNLSDWQAGNDALDMELTLAADRYTEVDSTLIPTGKLLAVEGTDLDFRTPCTIGKRYKTVDKNGYDHCLVLTDMEENLKSQPPQQREVGTLVDSKSGRGFKLLTTQPAVQVYGGGFLPKATIMGGKDIDRWYCLCLEAQHLPDTPNHPAFPTTVLRPGEAYKHTTTHQFFHRA
eukprot:TRINITY_DN61669_c0_g1_i1.p1 TRINITY_DN61669_c0_g1~~TRINITY_DN61669_c0_g1_i1.p1  ORF type:complete len:255 (-),score=21.33 TRINITY_DN61669_c0_g1_i1:89-853(-)